MTDIRCPKCGEPWDMDCIHEAIAEEVSREEIQAMNQDEYEKNYYNPKKRDFFVNGCSAFGGRCSGSAANPLIGMIYAELGDDLDGLAIEMEDMDYLFD